MRFLFRLLLNGVAIVVAAAVVPGIVLSGPLAAIEAGAILGLVNAVIRPILNVLMFPITVLTLGLFIFVINAGCLALTALVVPGFDLAGVVPAFAGALIVSLVSWVLSLVLVPNRRS